MENTREQATVLRQAGMTYAEIKNRLGVPLSTLSDWFKDQSWSKEVTKRIVAKSHMAGAMRFMVLNTVRGNRLKRVYEEARQDALVDFHDLKYHPLFMAGIFLYWGSGDKSSSPKVSFSSMDPHKIKLFVRFLERVCGIQKYRVQLLLAQNMDKEGEIKTFWTEKSSLNGANFLKSVQIKSKKTYSEPYYGVCNIIVNSAYLKNKILRWIDLFVEDIEKEGYLRIEE